MIEGMKSYYFRQYFDSKSGANFILSRSLPSPFFFPFSVG
jgi:hypothetical protein